MSDLSRVGSLLSLHGHGLLDVQYVGGVDWLRAARAYRLLPPLDRLLWEREPTCSVVPLARAERYMSRLPASVIWVRTRSGAAAAKLRQFRPQPCVVLREGASVRYVAFWALSEPLTPEWTEKATMRLAKWANGGSYADAALDFRFYLPGTVVRRGRPLPIELVRFEPELVAARDVVGRMKDPLSDAERREIFERHLERKTPPAEGVRRGA